MGCARTFGICLTASLALAVAAGSADALPEVGRCVSVASGGAYTEAACRKHALRNHPEEGRFNFEKTLAKPGFTESAIPASVGTESGFNVECSSFTATGLWDVDSSHGLQLPIKGAERVLATFSDCTFGTAKRPCADIHPRELEGPLGYLSTRSLHVGAELKSTVKKGVVAEFECENFGLITLGEGTGKLGDCFIGVITSPVNAMTTTTTELYTTIKGPEGYEQAPQAFEGKTTHCNVESKLGAGGWERAVFRLEPTFTFEEELEIKA